MNVREIDPERNRIWQFVVLAIAIATITALAWWTYRLFRNRTVLRKHLRRVAANDGFFGDHMPDVSDYLHNKGLRGWRRYAYLAGFRSIEKSGILRGY